MKIRKSMLMAAAVLCGTAAAFAGPKDDAQAALQKLADAPNYSWSTSTTGGMGGGQTVEGKASKDGVTHLNMTVRDEPQELFMKGQAAVIKTDEGWKTADELMQNAEPGQPNPSMMLVRMARNFKTPVTQASEMLAKVGDVTESDGAYVGEITGDDAKQLMQMRGGGGRRGGPDGGQGGGPGGPPRDGGGQGGGPGGPQGGPGGPGGQGGDRPAPPEIKDAKVVLRIWAKDGVATKMEYHMTGSMTVRGEEREIDRGGIIDVKDVGTTNIEVPDDVKAKLGQ